MVLNTLSTSLKNEDKILSHGSSENRKNRKRASEPDNPEIDECVLTWFKDARDKKKQPPYLRFSAGLGKSDFKASSSTLNCFKERNGISFKSMCGENESVSQEAANVWKGVKIIEETPAIDIFNVNETGVFFKSTMDKTLVF